MYCVVSNCTTQYRYGTMKNNLRYSLSSDETSRTSSPSKFDPFFVGLGVREVPSYDVSWVSDRGNSPFFQFPRGFV